MTIKKIATLGPQGTYSDAATAKYIISQGLDCSVEYFDSIKSALNSIGGDCEYGVLPIENLSEGFVSLVLDHLVDKDLAIIGELILPIQFSLVSRVEPLNKIEKLFVQFVAKGQCSEFIESLGHVEIVTTESNIESLEMLRTKEENSAAVVPALSFENKEFQLVIENINDYKNNQTRFLIFSSVNEHSCYQQNIDYKTSIIVLDDNDRPGLLEEILSSFSSRDINLTSIASRPTGHEFGKYHFFIDFDGHLSELKVSQALDEISKINKVKIMGSYPKAKSL